MLNIDINRLTDICLEYQQSRFYVGRIPDDFLSIAKKRFSIPKDDQIIAFLDTSVLGNLSKGSDGVLICQSGIYFRETFVHLYFPWHVFRNIPITLVSNELEIGKGNIFHLQHARMPSQEILLFIKNLKQHVNSLYEENKGSIAKFFYT
ncbi:hypothetical protein [Bacillus pseudomycoides]|uniref:hypothetical protein n=1 Tax=Bacillus pseudomycoides TaxID=64104 RepID=UPI00119ECD47|nr:hypothetical protein [Bacillus pseudomycoides]